MPRLPLADGVDRTLRNRYELKYVVAESVAARIEAQVRGLLRLDRYSALAIDGYYPIVSLYLDSRDLQLLRESLDGKGFRFKLRARTYGDGPEFPCFLEVKRRLNAVIAKTRARLSRSALTELLDDPTRGLETDDADLRTFKFLQAATGARPVALVRYRRLAYESDGPHRVRLTLDRDLGYQPCTRSELRLGGAGWTAVPLGGVILELKFTDRYPPWLAALVRGVEISSRSVSKYALCLEHAGRLPAQALA